MCFGVTSDYNEHTCLCLLRSLCLPPSNVHAIIEASNSEYEFILLPAYEFPDVTNKKKPIVIELVHLEWMKNRCIPLCSFKFRLTLYTDSHTYTHNCTLSELIISIARVSYEEVWAVFEIIEHHAYTRSSLFSAPRLQREKEIKFCTRARSDELF